jgi:hypothetical protein
MLFAKSRIQRSSHPHHFKSCNNLWNSFLGHVPQRRHRKIALAYTCCHPCQLHQSLPGITVPLSNSNQNMSGNSKHVLMDVHMCDVLDVILSKVSSSWTPKQICPHYTVKHSIHANVWGLGVAHHHSPICGTFYKRWKTIANLPWCCMVMCIECNLHIYTWHMGGIACGLGSTFQVRHFHSHTQTLLRICT